MSDPTLQFIQGLGIGDNTSTKGNTKSNPKPGTPSPTPSIQWKKKVVNIDRFGSFSYFQEKQSPDKIFVDMDEFNNLPLLSRKVASDIFP
jgi:hypothetical protein